MLTICALLVHQLPGAEVTVITHGYDSSVSGWVTAMADAIPRYYGFPSTNVTVFTITLTTDGTSSSDGSPNIYYQWSPTHSSPLTAGSGEIIVKLDWSQMAGGLDNPVEHPYDIDTYSLARAASWIMLQTNAISDLGGHALVEFPLHLIGHSRGGSLMTEICRRLGAEGVWVDQLTTLDPHPLNNDGNFDFGMPTDASAATTPENVLFHDNYWQNMGILSDPDGEPVAGAYNRELYSLDGGYNATTPFTGYHSNVHLWYYGTIDLSTPASDNEASVGETERQNWWASYEDHGIRAGFRYSLLAGGDRTSTDQPLGPGFSEIRDGYNQWWDFGAGKSNNRTALTSDSGAWPNIIRFDRSDTNAVTQGQQISGNLFYSWGQPTSYAGTISFYLDRDLNPLNDNETLLKQMSIVGSGGGDYVNHAGITLELSASELRPRWYALFAEITAGGRTRYFYAPQLVNVLAPPPPSLNISVASPGTVSIGVAGTPGQTVILERSDDLVTWLPVITNALTSAGGFILRAGDQKAAAYYRAYVQ
jgi:hypothetical protein